MPTKRSNSDAPASRINKGKSKRMARKSHHALAPSEAEELTPTQLTKQEFGRRLAALILERGWNQSDLVRKVNDMFPDLDRPFGRDAVSTYVNGRRFPTPKSLNMLCQALGVTRDELLPNASIQAINDENPALELRQAAGHPGKAWVRVNRMMSFDVAAKIVSLINEEDKRDFEKR